MIPSKPSFTNNDDQQHHSSMKLTINPRPSPLKINKESQTISKPSDHNHHHYQTKQRGREPVIIYTHSPKIIHAQARDFMALVQKLTGLSREHHEVNDSPNVKSDNKPSSILTDDITRATDNGGFHCKLSSGHSPSNSCFADISMFTPNDTDLNLFCCPRPVYRFNDAAVNAGSSSLSPSVLEFMKGLPEY